MSVDPNNKHPSFSSLLEQGFIDKIRMPAAFVKEHKKTLAKTALLKTDEGMSWEAKIVGEASDYFICEGDWPWFVVYNKLELGDMLIFYLVEKSTFHVLLYSKKPRTNIPHFEELSSSEDEEENIEASRKSKKVKTETKESLGDTEDDVSLDIHIKRTEIDKLLEGIASPSFTREDQLTNGGEGCKMHRQQCSMFYDVRRTVMDKEKAIAYQTAKANFTSKNPFFISFMHPSYISRSCNYLAEDLGLSHTIWDQHKLKLALAGERSCLTIS